MYIIPFPIHYGTSPPPPLPTPKAIHASRLLPRPSKI